MISRLDTPVLVLNWNGWEDTLQCLARLRQCDDVSTVWLIDNGSKVDRTGEASVVFPGLKLLCLDQNYGWAGGYNRALQAVCDEGYEFAYLLNNDCLPTRGFLKCASQAAREDAHLAAVGSRIEIIGEEDFEANPDHTCEVRTVETVCGAGMLMRLDALQQNGGFDERFFCYHEETEWCHRMSKAGWRIGMALGSVVAHRSEGSNVGANAQYYRVRNIFLFRQIMEPGFGMIGRTVQALHMTFSIRQARASGNRELWIATVAGVVDGLRGRYGPRGSDPSMAVVWSLSCISALVNAIRRLRRVTLRPFQTDGMICE